LDADALHQLLGGGPSQPGNVKSSGNSITQQGAGWAGSRFWKYRSAAAAAARMAAGISGSGVSAQVKRAAATAAGGGRSKASTASPRIDFTAPPADLASALAAGSKRQTDLLTATSSSAAAATLLPEDLHYQVTVCW
jgi:hypothetical protein